LGNYLLSLDLCLGSVGFVFSTLPECEESSSQFKMVNIIYRTSWWDKCVVFLGAFCIASMCYFSVIPKMTDTPTKDSIKTLSTGIFFWTTKCCAFVEAIFEMWLMASIAQRNKNLVCDSTTFPLQPSFFNFHLLCQTMMCSTNSLDYPEVWDSLERLGTHKIFFQSANDCRKDHFKDESECAIVDRCSKANFAQVTMQQVNLKDTVKVQSNRLRDGVKMDRPEQLSCEMFVVASSF
jgi:hypothetical protein